MALGNGEDKLVIASNRLPVSVKDLGESGYKLKTSSGGLVSALQGLAKSGHDFTWYGWPGAEIDDNNASDLSEELSRDHNAVPVFLNRKTAEKYYNGFSSMEVYFPLKIHETDTRRLDHLASVPLST